MKALFLRTTSALLRSSVLYSMLLVCAILFGRNVFAADSDTSMSVSSGHVSVTVTAGSGNDNKASVNDDAKDGNNKDENKDSDNNEDGDAHHDHDSDNTVGIGHDSTLAAGEHTRDLVSVFGSSTNEGDVSHDVVSVLGSTRVTGFVGHDAVAVLGSAYVNNKVGHDVVAVLGDVELGPQAEVGGHVVSVGGVVKRDPAAIIHGGVQSTGFGMHLGNFAWLHSWIDNCLLYGRPLAFAPNLGWAWTLALVSLFFYVFTALLFPRGVERCVQVLEEHPGYSLLSALLAVLASPILIVLLCITIIGIIAIPFVGLSLLAASSFGKLVMLAWLGRRLVKPAATSSFVGHPAFAVLLGGIIVLIIYVVPFLGFIVYKLLGFVGLGVVIYTLLLAMQSRRSNRKGGPGGQGSGRDETSAAAADLADKGANEGIDAASASAINAQTDTETDTQTGSTTSESQARQTHSTQTDQPIRAVDMIDAPRAEFWLRMVALLLDVILVNVLISFTFNAERFGFDSHHLLLVTLAIYGAVMWKLKGATIGDIVCKIQIVRLDGRAIDWPTAIVRSLSCFLSLIVVGLGFIWIAFDEQKQAWHDKIAGTVVVRVSHSMSLV